MDYSDALFSFFSEQTVPDSIKNKILRSQQSDFLEAIASLALDPTYTDSIFKSFKQFAIDILARWSLSTQVIAGLGRVLPALKFLIEPAVTLLRLDDEETDLLSILQVRPDSVALQDSEDSLNGLREVLLGVLRLLNCNNTEFAPLIRPARLQVLLQNPDRSIRYLAIRIICMFLHASDNSTQELISTYLGSDEIVGPWESKIIDYRFFELWEEKRRNGLQNWSDPTISDNNRSTRLDGHEQLLEDNAFTPAVVNVAGVLLPRRQQPLSGIDDTANLVLSPTAKYNAKRVATALNNSNATLITGLPGSGKTSIVKYLAQGTGNLATMLSLHLNEQTDAKLLVGIYTTGSLPGSFEWHPGLLTTAVREGRWVFVEDIDRAPLEVMSTILPLIEHGELSLPNRGEKLKAALGFRIIATMRSQVNMKGEEVLPINRMLGSRLWERIAINDYSLNELKDIVITKFPPLSVYSGTLMAVYQRLRDETQTMSSVVRRTQISRPITGRELLKWCHRANALLEKAMSSQDSSMFNEKMIDTIFLDAADCFLGSIETFDLRNKLVAFIAEEMHIDGKRYTHLQNQRVPNYNETNLDGKELICVGRSSTGKKKLQHGALHANKMTELNLYAKTRHSLQLLEKVMVAAQYREPLLLVGETGIGKTAAVQHLAKLTGQTLYAINLSQESESADLLGGYKPVGQRTLILPLKAEFEDLFEHTFSHVKNQQYSILLSKSISKQQWKRVILLWKEALKMVDQHISKIGVRDHTNDDTSAQNSPKRRKINTQLDAVLYQRWQRFAEKVHSLEQRFNSAQGDVSAFSFIEGNLVRAARDGHWVLLDEINLASADMLECLAGLLDSGPESSPSLLLTETGSVERIVAHPDFRIFAAMNPATDVGKRDLPWSIRSRFTEIYVDSPDQDLQSLHGIIEVYLHKITGNKGPQGKMVAAVAELYQDIQSLVASGVIVDGNGQRPHFSIRSLTRALSHATAVAPMYGLRRAIFEGFSMCFLTTLSSNSERSLEEVMSAKIFVNHRSAKAELRRTPRSPENESAFQSIKFQIDVFQEQTLLTEEHHWVPRGAEDPLEPQGYILTPYVFHNLRNLIRSVFTKRHPILIQGPTSAGKTSMIEYLARRSGNRFVRVNNHEHTDLQEYLGAYVSTPEGKLVYQDGILVKAVREGHWLVLDELNLAPSDILEALNRLLDDNRELLIPETQEVIRPHPQFVLFATQNPVGPYGGRKTLSRAFRNRFVELHFDDIPINELKIILARRSQLPESWCELIVETYKRLSRFRQEQRLFETNSFATLRDLFRWSFRKADTIEQLARNGYMLLGEKVRNGQEKNFVRETIVQVLGRKGADIKIDEHSLYGDAANPQIALYNNIAPEGVVWTRSMKRLFALVAEAVENNEPILLVGETGCGKTTVCQMLAVAMRKKIHIINAHQNTETSDLIGAQRPVRNRGAIAEQLEIALRDCLKTAQPYSADEKSTLTQLLETYRSLNKSDTGALPEETRLKISRLIGKQQTLFEWHDGSLPQAMKLGDFYLLDEISLAEDSVLERMNSVLESERTLLLAEKGTKDIYVKATHGFQFFATMNPGGDFGKKELSPALRNRFTEIWVPPLCDTDDVLQIVRQKLRSSAWKFAPAMVAFAEWFAMRYFPMKASTFSIRDMLTWVTFVNGQSIPDDLAVRHGASLVFIDTLGANPSTFIASKIGNLNEERLTCFEKLKELMVHDVREDAVDDIGFTSTDDKLHLGLFSITKRPGGSWNGAFNFQTPTVKSNMLRLIRALQLPKSVLIEGSPGVGKTSIVTAIAQAAGYPLIRINLSEQTDITDLFGGDVPKEGAGPGEFVWRDGVFLEAIKNGSWVLLDEMNLASQSILEGLNACLDHRGEIYLPELDRSFMRHSDFRLFATQNPHHEGGGRKGLPSSFVNRFTVIFADSYQQEDALLILKNRYPEAESIFLENAVSFVTELNTQTKNHTFGSLGSPWEFNLRDMIRWLDLTADQYSLLRAGSASYFVKNLFSQRFRQHSDVEHVNRTYEKCFKTVQDAHNLDVILARTTLQIGAACLPRGSIQSPQTDLKALNLTGRTSILETMMICIQRNWPILLVGYSGVGKTYMIERLACLLGVELEMFHVNAEIDATDLIGSFDQSDLSRRTQVIMQDLECHLRSRVNVLLLDTVSADAAEIRRLILYILHLMTLRKKHSVDLRAFLVVIAQLLNLWEDETTQNFASQLKQLDAPANVQVAKFEWIDGLLIQAVERGRWLILENANLCSPSVLDRLNSLLEPNGVLVVSEHGNEDGSMRTIIPHPNFRLFLTLDPVHGEISRAMRNRVVEIYVPPVPSSSSDRQSRNLWHDSSLQRYRDILEVTSSVLDLDRSRRIWRMVVNSLAFCDLPKSDQFLLQLRSGLGTGFSAADFESSSVLLKHKSAHNMLEYLSEVQTYYQKICSFLQLPPDVQTHQAIDTSFNTVMCRYSHSVDKTNTAGRLSDLLYLKIELLYMQKFFDEALTRARYDESRTILKISLSAMRSAQSKNGLYTGVAPFLKDVLDCYSDWIDEIHVSKDCHFFTFEIWNNLRFWWALARLATEHSVDSFNFQAYVQYGTSINNRPKRVLHTQETIFDRLEKTYKTHLGGLEQRTGHSMELIWNDFQTHAIDGKAWSKMLSRASSTTDMFDDFIWRARIPLNEILPIRDALLSAIRKNMAQESELEAVLEQANNIMSNFGDKASQVNFTQSPLFAEAFENFCEILDLYGGDVTPTGSQAVHNAMKSLSTNSLFAKRRTRCLIDQFAEDTLPSKLMRLARFDGAATENLASITLNHNLQILCLRKLDLASNISADSLNLLTAEIELLGHNLSLGLAADFENNISQLRSLITAIALDILSLHSACLDPKFWGDLKARYNRLQHESAEVAEDINTEVEFIFSEHLPADHYFRDIANNFFAPWLKFATQTPSVQEKDQKSMGFAILALFTGFLYLYIPLNPRDPCKSLQVQFDWQASSLEELQAELLAASSVDSFYLGHGSNYRRIKVEELIGHVRSPKSKPPVYDRDIVKIKSLWEQLSNVMHLIKTISTTLLSKPGVAVDMSSPTLMPDLTKILEKLSPSIELCEDIAIPATAFLHGVRIGLSLFQPAQQYEQEVAKVNDTIASTPFMGGRIWNWSIGFDQNYPNEKIHDPHLAYQTLQTLGVLGSLQRPLDWDKTAQTKLMDMWRDIHIAWRQELDAEQRKTERFSRMYRYRGDEEMTEEELEAELVSLFPSWEDNIGGPNEARDVDAEENITEGHAQSWNAYTVQLAQLHQNIFFGDLTTEKAIRELLLDTGNTIVQTIHGQNIKILEESSQDLMSTIMSKINQISRKLNSEKDEGLSLNVYEHGNVSQMQAMLAVVKGALTHFRWIQKAWPDHQSPQNIITVCLDILLVGYNEPLMKLITRIETLYERVTEWQSVTSKEYSASLIQDRIVGLIIEWRRLELLSWSGLLDREVKSCEDAAQQWWFVAYENVIANSTTGANEPAEGHLVELISVLQDFLLNCALGQYRTKIRILSAICEHVKIYDLQTARLRLVLRALRNTIDHFGRFEEVVHAKIQDGRRTLEKEIKEIIQLAAWKDRNISALRQSAKSSHRRLFRVVKKFRDLLSSPVSGIIQNSLYEGKLQVYSSAIATSTTPVGHSALNSAKDLSHVSVVLESDVQRWATRPKRFRQTLATANKVSELCSPLHANHSTASNLRDFVTALDSEIQDLRTSTPKSLTEDNSSLVKHLGNRKRILFADVLKAVKLMGIKSNHDTSTLATQSSLSNVLTMLYQLECYSTSIALSTRNSIHQLLDIIPQIRTTSNNHHEDLGQAEVVRSIGYIEGLLRHIINADRHASSHAHKLQRLKSLISTISALWSGESCQVKSASLESCSLPHLRSILQWIPVLIETSMNYLQLQAKFSHVDQGIYTEKLRSWKEIFEGLVQDVMRVPAISDSLTSKQLLLCAQKSWQTVQDFKEFLKICISDVPSMEWTLRSLLKHLQLPSMTGRGHDMEPAQNEMAHLEAHYSSQFTMLDTLLNTIEKAHSRLAIPFQSNQDTSWLVENEKLLLSQVQAFSMDRVTAAIERCLDEIGYNFSSQVHIEHSCASLWMSLPILEQYVNSVQQVINRYETFHEDFCSTAIFLAKCFESIAREGFCQPTENAVTDAQARSSKLESGTGLGDGEGAEDISKDIGDDEDLSELAQEQDNKVNNMENEDDAVSMDGELAAEQAVETTESDDHHEAQEIESPEADMEDGNEGSDNGFDNDENMNDDETESGARAEGSGEVDEGSQSKIDEKLWDDAGDDSRKNRNEDSSSGKRQDETTAARDPSNVEDTDAEKVEGGEETNSEDGTIRSEEMESTSESGAVDTNDRELERSKVDESAVLDLPEDLKLDQDKQKEGSDAALDSEDDMSLLEDEHGSEIAESIDDVNEDEIKETGQPDEADNASVHKPEINEGGENELAQSAEKLVSQDETSNGTGDQQANGTGPETIEADEHVKSKNSTEEKTSLESQKEVEALNDSVLERPDETVQPSSSAQANSGSILQQGNQQKTPDPSQPNDSTPDDASTDRRKIRQLGDLFKQWRQDRRPIFEPTQLDNSEPDQPDLDVADADLEYADEDSRGHDQALGAAEAEQAKRIDYRMAISSEQEQEDNRMQENLDEDEDTHMMDKFDGEHLNEDIHNQEQEASTEKATSRPSTFVGQDHADRDVSQNSAHNVEMEIDESVEDVEDHLSAMQLKPESSQIVFTDEAAAAIWRGHEARTHDLSLSLTEQLRLILAPSLATKLRGDFRTGKRLNIKRIIPYIASQYKRDKIWMRRSAPSKRSYQILLSIDDSKSMGENRSWELAFETLALVSRSLSMLEVGEIAVAAFGEQIKVAHPFGKPFTSEAGVEVIKQFGFRQEGTNVKKLMASALDLFAEARQRSSSRSSSGVDLWQLQLIISDGICGEHESIRRLLLKAYEARIMTVFVVVDDMRQDQSIIDLERVEFIQPSADSDTTNEASRPQFRRIKYLDEFPFRYYIVVRNVRELPGVLAAALRQWFAEVAER